MSPSERKKKKKSERTKEAILNSARKAFLTRGYDQAGLRDIAADAGVTAALINRYFGTKKALYSEILRGNVDYAGLYHATPDQIGHRIAEFLIEGKVQVENGESLQVDTDQLLLYLRSVTSPEALPIIREVLAEKITAPMQATLPGGDVKEKAALLISHVFGFILVHRLIGAACTVGVDKTLLQQQLGASLQAIVDS